ncbi:MAG: DUF3127 domain-containing protein [Bacteroidales bacterium]|nr:DUF3127 domain-containing protein [Candidatus Liminaster caballi]
MNAIVYVKMVGGLEPVQTKNGEVMNKRTVVLTTKECRTTDDGTMAVDQDMVFELLKDKAENFPFAGGEWLCIKYSMVMKEFNGRYWGENRLVCWARI